MSIKPPTGANDPILQGSNIGLFQDFGARGDGTTDDTTAFAAAFTEVSAAGGGVLQGTANAAYIINPSQLNIPANTVMVGNGAILKMKPGTATAAGIFYLFGCATGTADVDISGFTFHGNRSNGNHGTSENIDGLHLTGPQRWKIHHNRFTNFRSEGLYVSKGSNQPTAVEFTDNLVDDVGKKEGGDSGATRQGITYNCGDELLVANNRFYDIGSYGVDFEANIAGQTFDGLVVVGNTFDTVVDGAVNIAPQLVAEAVNVVVANNTISGSTVQGFVIKATGAVVSGNTGLSCTTRGLWLVSGSSNIVATGNALKATGAGASVADVYLDAATRCVVSGNTLLGTTGAAGIKEAGASDFNAFFGNQISHATRYVLVGSSTATNETQRQQTFTISPPSGSSNITLGGTSGNIVAASTQVLNLDFAQIISKISGTERARIRTDGRMELSVRYVSGAGKTNLVDGDFSGTVQDGELGVAHNTTDSTSRICARANGTWKVVAVA